MILFLIILFAIVNSIFIPRPFFGFGFGPRYYRHHHHHHHHGFGPMMGGPRPMHRGPRGPMGGPGRMF